MHDFVYNLFYKAFTFFNFLPYTTTDGFFDMAAWFYLGMILLFLGKIFVLGNPYWHDDANFRDLEGKFKLKAVFTYAGLNFLRFCFISTILFNCFHFGWTMGLYTIHVIVSIVYAANGEAINNHSWLSFANGIYDYYESHMKYEKKVITRSEKFRTLFLNQNL